MGDTDNWRTEVDAADFFGGQKKRQNIDARRPVPRNPSDLGLGPGMSANAIRVDDLNNLLATFNGFYSALGDEVMSGPTTDAVGLVGFVVSDADLGGFQQFTRLDTGVTYRRIFNRAPFDPESITWQDWETL